MNRRTLLTAVGAALVLLLLWSFLLWRPQSSAVRSAEDRAAAAETQHTELQLRLARLQAAEERSAELTAARDTMRRAVPEAPELAQFILDANDIAVTSGVAFLSISPSPPAAPADGTLPAEIALTIAVRGTYEAVIDYLELLERLPRIVVVDNLSLNPDAEGNLAVSVTARMFTTALPASATTTLPPAAGAATTTTVAAGG